MPIHDKIICVIGLIICKKPTNVKHYPYIHQFNNIIESVQFNNIYSAKHSTIIRLLYLLNGYVYGSVITKWCQDRGGPRLPYKFYHEFDNGDPSRNYNYLIKKHLWHPYIYDCIEQEDNKKRYLINHDKCKEIGIDTYKGGKLIYHRTFYCINIK
jgi:hypothetical protein